ncbi:MAG: aldose 1-epimerase [Rhodospirillales bacterium]|nr:aldose 1-epimerase [Rhodospirillales bacterium]
MSQNVTIGNGQLTAIVAAKGAEIQSLVPAGGQDVMWTGDADVWPWHAPNLFPIVGALADDALVHEGERYPMKQHGFLRNSLCEVTLAAPESCAFRLADNQDTREQYPFAFALTVAYRLAGDRLDCTFSLHNPDTVPLYASIGTHPGFRRPLGNTARDAHVVLFDHPEPAPIRRLDARTLDLEPKPTPVEGRVLLLRDVLFDDDAVIFDRLTSRRIIYGAPGGPAVEMDFPDFPDLGIWAKPGIAPFVCLEPWQGMASPAGFAGEFSLKPGVVSLQPGATRDWHYSIRILPEMPELPR